jgi:hypothetical protein
MPIVLNYKERKPNSLHTDRRAYCTRKISRQVVPDLIPIS